MGRIRHQEGRVEEVGKVKKWKGHYYTYDQDGTRHHRSVDLGLKKDKPKHKAKEDLRAIIERETHGPVRTSGEDTFAWFWNQRYAPFQPWTPKRRKSTEGAFRNHVLPLLGNTKLNQIDKYQIQILMKGLGHYSHSMCELIQQNIKRALEEAVEQDLISRNPAQKVKIPQEAKKPAGRYLTMEEIDYLIAELGFRDRLICQIAIVLGLRPAELFGLKWEDFDEANGQLRIDESYDEGEWKPTKTRGSNAWVSMPKAIARQISVWREMSSGPYMFTSTHGTPLNRAKFLQQVLIPAAIRAGIVQPRPKGLPKGSVWSSKTTAINFQAFRRTCATWAQTTGTLKDVQAHLRHSNPATTMKHYIQQIPASTRIAVEDLNARLFNSGPINSSAVQ